MCSSQLSRLNIETLAHNAVKSICGMDESVNECDTIHAGEVMGRTSEWEVKLLCNVRIVHAKKLIFHKPP